jgi:hypothetical protein
LSQRASAYYSASIDQFMASDPQFVLGALAAAHMFDLEVDQRHAWEEEIEVLSPNPKITQDARACSSRA